MIRTNVAILAALITAAPAIAQLTPPPGAPAETNRVREEADARIPIGPDTTPGDEDSLFKIRSGGSYYLTGNIITPLGFHAIEIAGSAPETTIDLNGFSVTSRSIDGTLTTPRHGVFVDSTSFITVRVTNGFIDTCLGAGILHPGRRLSVDNVIFRNNRGPAIECGDYATIEDCTFHFNGTLVTTFPAEIAAGAFAVVQRNEIHSSRSTAVSTSREALIRGNYIQASSAGDALVVNSACRVDDNHIAAGDIRHTSGDNMIVRNYLDGGIITGPFSTTNSIGPSNDLNSPWANFIKN